ncbi:hypothetical protein C8Q79DRAFT_1015314 [Trametes meyenii]|nr:hypothetical protein C8Q79DRAFT_1015314 [Trametes meyenii]
MTGLASLIFFLDPVKSAPGATEGSSLASNATESVGSEVGARAEALAQGKGSNSYAIIYRLGGLFAAIAFVLTLCLACELRHH